MLPISLTWLARMHRFVPEERFMRLALEEAQDAFDEGEVPIGAVIVCQGQVIARQLRTTLGESSSQIVSST